MRLLFSRAGAWRSISGGIRCQIPGDKAAPVPRERNAAWLGGDVGGGSLRPGGRLSLGTDPPPSPSVPLRRSLEILRVCSAFQRASPGASYRLSQEAPPAASLFPKAEGGASPSFCRAVPTLRQPPQTRQPSLSHPSPAALPLPRGAGRAWRAGGGRPGRPPCLGQRRLGRSSVRGKGGIGASGGRPCGGSPRPRQRPPGTCPPGLAGFAFLERPAPPLPSPPPSKAWLTAAPEASEEGRRLLRRAGKEAAEALSRAGGCLRGRARPASPPDRLSWSIQGPPLPPGRGWLSDSASREVDRSEGAHGRGDWELRSPQLMARDGTEVRPGNPVAAGIQGPPCSLEDDEVFLGTEARPSTTQADPFRHCSVEELYELLETLGSGHFGVVRRCRERSTGVFYAAKSIKMRKRKGSRLGLDREQVEREVCILQQLQHPNIMRLYDIFANQAEMVLILELIQGGELFDFIAEKELVSEEEAIEFLQQILLGLAYMHAHHIAHFDLKPENLMLLEKEAPSPKIKIIDFGLAQKLEEGVSYKSLCGTPQYIAPEVINYEALSTATDMWSIGVITYILLSGMSPFQGETDEETLSNVVSGNYEFEAKYFSQTSEMAKDFIQKLLLKEPRDRMTAAECLLHPWIKPLTRKQAMNRSRSSINMKNFRKFNARRKWKLSYHMVSACNRLCRLRLLCQQQKPEEEEEAAMALRDCESDQEDQPSSPGVLLRRRRSICS